MEANCKLWIHGANFMMDGYIDNDNMVYLLVPGHGGRSALPILASIAVRGFTIYPG